MKPKPVKALPRYSDTPPIHDIQMERNILFCIITSGADNIMARVPFLRAGMFYDARHELIFAACRRLYDRAAPIDIVTVPRELEAHKHLELVGGDGYLIALTNELGHWAHWEEYAKQVLNDFTLRRLRGLACELAEAPETNKDSQELVNQTIEKLLNIQGHITGGEILTSRDLALEVMDDLDIIAQPDKPRNYITTAFPALNDLIAGFEEGKLYLIAARTGCGKTDLMLNLALDIAKSHPVGIISAEMKGKALVRRMVSNLGNLNRLDVRRGILNPGDMDEVIRVVSLLADHNIYIYDYGRPTALDIRAKAMTLVGMKKIKVLFIDHLHRLKFHTHYKAMHDNVREVVAELADTARALNIPIIVNAQLNREFAKENKRPVREQLREGGEDDADDIILLWRPGAYQHPQQDTLEMIVAKSRDGATGVVYSQYDLTTGRIGQCESNHPPEGHPPQDQPQQHQNPASQPVEENPF